MRLEGCDLEDADQVVSKFENLSAEGRRNSAARGDVTSGKLIVSNAYSVRGSEMVVIIFCLFPRTMLK